MVVVMGTEFKCSCAETPHVGRMGWVPWIHFGKEALLVSRISVVNHGVGGRGLSQSANTKAMATSPRG